MDGNIAHSLLSDLAEAQRTGELRPGDPIQRAREELVVEKTGRVRQVGASIEQKEFVNRFKALCETDLYSFCKGVLGLTLLTPTLHRPICREFLGRELPRRKLMLLPRDHLKSSICGRGLPIHILIQPATNNIYFPGCVDKICRYNRLQAGGKDCFDSFHRFGGQNTRILLAYETATNAQGQLRWIKAQFSANRLLRALWEDRIWANPAKEAAVWNAERIVLRREFGDEEAQPSIDTAGVGAATTGRHYNCIAEGSLVYTSKGLVPIEEVRIGTRVLARDGHHHEVEATHKTTQVVGETVVLNVNGQPEDLRCTLDHRLLVWRDGPQWVEAHQVTVGDRLCLPLPSGRTRAVSRVNAEVNRICETPDCWRLLGYWLAEGAASAGNRIRLTFGVKERTLACDAKRIVEEHLGVEASVTEGETSTLVVSFFHEDFKAVTAKFGTHAYNKYLPPLALAQGHNMRTELARGYFLGDGCRLRGRSGWSAVTTSRSLAAGLQLLLGSLGIPSTVRKDHDGGPKLVVDNLCETRPAYTIAATHPMMDVLMGTRPSWVAQPTVTRVVPGFLLCRVRTVGRERGSAVFYDLQVADAESFTLPGTCVHNCHIFDDLFTLEAANSDEVAHTTTEWFKASRAMLDDPDYSLEWTIGTRWAPADMYQWIIDHDETVEVVVRAAIEHGKPIFPEVFTLQTLETKRKQLGPLFYLLYMNSAVDSALVDFDPADLREYRVQGSNLVIPGDDRDLRLAARFSRQTGDSETPKSADPPFELRGSTVAEAAAKLDVMRDGAQAYYMSLKYGRCRAA